MGLFTRKDSASDSSPSRPRPSVTSEAQAAELRGKARRRLAGAIALVLAAVIILPMMLDSEPVPVSEDIPVRIPDRGTPYQPNVSEPGQTPSAQNGATPESGQPATPPDLIAGNTQSPATQPPAQQAPANQPPQQQVPATQPPVQQPPVQPPHTQTPPPKPPETKPVEKPPVKPPAKPETSQRSDDGARALALLEGRSPAAQAPAAKPKPAANGNFVLQVASYTTQNDAQERRGKLHQAGVTNAFVEQANINGKQQYRLRVGPFPSREAAQAAQARLRTLGYDNGFIAAQ